MSRPTQGKHYITQSDDSLESIAAKAYGIPSKWTLIKDANVFEYKVTSPSDVKENEDIFIPFDPEFLAIKAARES